MYGSVTQSMNFPLKKCRPSNARISMVCYVKLLTFNRIIIIMCMRCMYRSSRYSFERIRIPVTFAPILLLLLIQIGNELRKMWIFSNANKWFSMRKLVTQRNVSKREHFRAHIKLYLMYLCKNGVFFSLQWHKRGSLNEILLFRGNFYNGNMHHFLAHRAFTKKIWIKPIW